MLGDQQGGRDQDRDLLGVHHRLEGGADRDLGLAVADVAADQPVHRHGLLHVALDVVDRGQLVGRLGVVEGILQLALHRAVGAEREALTGPAGGIEADQFAGDLLDRLAGAGLALGPVRPAHPVQHRCLTADVAGDLVELLHRDEDPVPGLTLLAGGVLDHHVVAGGSGDGALDHLDVAAHAMVLVHDRIAGLQLQRVDRLAAPARHLALGPVGLGPAGQVTGGPHRQPDTLDQEAVPDAGGDQLDDLGDRRLGDVLDDAGSHLVLGQQLGQPLGRAVPLGRHDDPPTVPDGRGDLGDSTLGVAGPALRVAGPDRTDRGRPRRDVGQRLGGRVVPLVRGRGERRHRPPRLAPLPHVRADVAERLVTG